MTKQKFSHQEIKTALRKIILERSNHGQLDHELYEMAIPSYLHWNPLVRWIIRERLYTVNTLIEQNHVKIGGGGKVG
jgi:hypothetical protein